MKTLLKSSFLALFLLAGCINPSEIFNPTVDYPESTNTTSAVIVCIEDSYAGYNTGALKDLEIMTNLCAQVTDDIVVLKNGRATRKNVKEAIARACSNELAIVYFTCHGGQERAAKEDRDFEEDGKDEFIYLSDSSISDNELWKVFKTSTNRVFTIFNCCHAGTMFRVAGTNEVSAPQPPPFTMKAATADSEKYPFTLLSWSACKDNAYAYTFKEGGIFTQSLRNTYNAFKGDVTYDLAWTVIGNASEARKYQVPQRHVIGDYSRFENKLMFR